MQFNTIKFSITQQEFDCTIMQYGLPKTTSAMNIQITSTVFSLENSLTHISHCESVSYFHIQHNLKQKITKCNSELYKLKDSYKENVLTEYKYSIALSGLL